MPDKSKNSRRAQAKSKKDFTRRVFALLQRVAGDHELPPAAEVIAIVLTDYFNKNCGGAAWPSLHTIATDAGLGKTTVIRTLRAMEARGHLRIEWGKQGSGNVSKYWMGDQEQQLQKRSQSGPLKGPRLAKKSPETDLNHLKNHLNAPKGAFKMERERQALRAHFPARAA